MDLVDLLYVIAKRFYERNNYGLGRTKLLKLAYLAEVFFKRLTGKRLTDADWVFWQYGPYIMDYPKVLHSNAFLTEQTENDFQAVLPAEDYRQSDLNMDAKLAVSRAMEFAGEDLNELLDYVYFDTEPMMTTRVRGDKLDFNCVRPEGDYAIKDLALPIKSRQEIAKKIQEWKKNAYR